MSKSTVKMSTISNLSIRGKTTETGFSNIHKLWVGTFQNKLSARACVCVCT